MAVSRCASNGLVLGGNLGQVGQQLAQLQSGRHSEVLVMLG